VFTGGDETLFEEFLELEVDRTVDAAQNLDVLERELERCSFEPDVARGLDPPVSHCLDLKAETKEDVRSKA
jgi:hypothetical protein